MNITLAGTAEQFVGQDLAGWQIEHLGVALDGNPIRQARQTFPGGEQIAQQGEWIVTLTSGQQLIVHELPKEVPVADADAPAAGESNDVQEPAVEAAPADSETAHEGE